METIQLLYFKIKTRNFYNSTRDETSDRYKLQNFKKHVSVYIKKQNKNSKNYIFS